VQGTFSHTVTNCSVFFASSCISCQ